MERIYPWFLTIIIIVGIILCIGACCADHQVETYTIGVEVSGIHYTGKYHDNAVVRVRCDEFAAAIPVSNKQAARYREGDIVVVEVEVRDGWGGEYQQYTLIG